MHRTGLFLEGQCNTGCSTAGVQHFRMGGTELWRCYGMVHSRKEFLLCLPNVMAVLYALTPVTHICCYLGMKIMAFLEIC